MGDPARGGPLGARRFRLWTRPRQRQVGDLSQVHRRDGRVVDRVGFARRRLRRLGETPRQPPHGSRKKMQAQRSLLLSIMAVIYEENRSSGMENRAGWV